MRKAKNLIFLIFIFVSFEIFPQVPQSFKYQAMARNANGDVIVNKTISLLVDIIQGTTTVYTESHNVVTNQFGLINLEIGNGNTISGTFANIDWSLGDYYIAVSLDPEGGTNYSSVGTAQLLSVPYALYANRSGDSYWKKNQLNLYFSQGNVGIGTSQFGGTFNPRLIIRDGYVQISDSSDTKDAALVINHLRRAGYGFSRTLQIVHEGVTGDPYSEYRIRNTNDDATVTSWSLGIDNSDEDKFVLTNALNVPTGSSPSTGNRVLSITTSGNFGIGSANPDKKLVIEDNIDGINYGNRRIFVELNNKSVDIASEVEMNLKAGTNGTITKILKYSETYNAYPGQEVANYGMLSDDGGGIIIRAWDNSGKIIFKTAHDGTYGHGIERMRIDSQGRVGIGVEQPERTLQIKDVMRIEPSAAPANPKEGDIYMDAATHKLMVYDGTTWQACW